MKTLIETYKEIITEAISNSDVIDAINNNSVVKFYYEGDETQNKGDRMAELYAFGLSLKGNPVVRAFQIRGATDTVIPDWKLFRLKYIRDIEVIRNFYRPRNGFNKNDDNGMSTVYHIAKF